VAAGTGIVLASNYGLLSDAKGFFIAAGIVGLGLGLMRLMRRVFRKKTLTLPPLQLRRKAENVTRNAIDTFTTPTQSNRLTRSDTDKVIMGVSGGLAAHSGISSTLIRAAWIIAFAATSGVAAAFYVLLALFMPPAAPRGLPPSRK
jgi:phage shock protein PspC (stress-responsive transcriptional regulator)